MSDLTIVYVVVSVIASLIGIGLAIHTFAKQYKYRKSIRELEEYYSHESGDPVEEKEVKPDPTTTEEYRISRVILNIRAMLQQLDSLDDEWGKRFTEKDNTFTYSPKDELQIQYLNYTKSFRVYITDNEQKIMVYDYLYDEGYYGYRAVNNLYVNLRKFRVGRWVEYLDQHLEELTNTLQDLRDEAFHEIDDAHIFRKNDLEG